IFKNLSVVGFVPSPGSVPYSVKVTRPLLYGEWPLRYKAGYPRRSAPAQARPETSRCDGAYSWEAMCLVDGRDICAGQRVYQFLDWYISAGGRGGVGNRVAK